ncbi:PorT family protein [Parabacteroides sp. W1-Q-101]|uniref:porin family protein n=1 Tax=Parabacteroides TaxID=375288 RepID=UPI00202F8106|nr:MULTISPECIES: porin family protein [Parabacteroides]MCM0719563.1 PorT family protein [Parabacteroides sp. W1-Q-101]
MKRLFFLFILFISSIEINAQWSISPEIGIASVKRNDFGDSWGTGIKAGLGVGYQFQTNLGLKTGLYYATRGYSLGAAFGHYEYPSDDYFHELAFENKLRRNFLQLPIMLNYSLPLSKDVTFNFAAGPYLGVSVKDYWTGGYYTEEHDKSVFDGLRAFDWGVSATAGIDVHNWIMSVGYDLSLGKEDKSSGINANYHSMSFNFGYKFSFPGK